MKLEELFSEWEKDSHIDKSELSDESVKIPKLHHKYYQILIAERSLYFSLDTEYKKLKLKKYEFYVQGHNEETKKLGWTLPPRGMILKSDIPMYLESDSDLLNIYARISIQKEKIEFVESIIKTVMSRAYIISNIINWTKFTNGG